MANWPRLAIVRKFGVNGNNFIKTMLRLGRERGEVSVVNDQIGSPTYTYDLAKLCVDMIVTDKYGTYHATNEGICSWYEFACEIFKQANLEVKVNPVDVNNVIGNRKDNIKNLKEVYDVDLIVKSDDSIKQGKSKINITKVYKDFKEEENEKVETKK